MIATFEDEPYRAPFSRQRDRALPGRRADLDAVPLRGAAVGDPERADRLRPLPGRLQHQRHHARGQGQADPLAQPPRGRRGLALRQGPLRVRRTCTRPTASRTRCASAATRLRAARLGATRSTRPSGCSARRGPSIVTALSGSRDRRAGLRARQAPARRASARTPPCCPRRSPTALDRFRAPLSSIRDADVVVVLGDEPVARARADRRPLDQGRAPQRRTRRSTELADEAVRGAKRAILIWCGPTARRARRRWLARDGSARVAPFYLPATRRTARGVCDAWAAPPTASRPTPEPVGLLIVSGDEAAANPAVRALAEHAERRARHRDVRRARRGWADLVLPGTSYLERDGTYVNLEGRLQRLRRAVIAACAGRAGVDREARRALRRRRSRRTPSLVFEEVSAICYGGIPFGEIGEQAPLPPRADGGRSRCRTRRRAEARRARGLRLVTLPPALLRARRRARRPSSQFQRPRPRGRARARRRARPRHRAPATTVTVLVERDVRRSLRARIARDLPPGMVRDAEDHAEGLHDRVEVREVSHPTSPGGSR